MFYPSIILPDDEERPKTRKEKTKEEKRLEKKAKLKARFDAMYDDGDKGEGQTYFDVWKSELEVQAQVRFYCYFYIKCVFCGYSPPFKILIFYIFNSVAEL